MRIITIQGSPRRQGNTAKILGWIEDHFQAEGHAVDHVHVVDYRVQGCGECLACKKGRLELCSIEDDANTLFRRMAKADLVLFAAPVFCWGFPAQLKALLDRMFCLMDFGGDRTDVPRLHGKPIGLLLTGGGEEADNADMVLQGFGYLVEYLKARPAGNLFVPGCTVPEAMGDDEKERAILFAQMLAHDEG